MMGVSVCRTVVPDTYCSYIRCLVKIYVFPFDPETLSLRWVTHVERYRFIASARPSTLTACVKLYGTGRYTVVTKLQDFVLNTKGPQAQLSNSSQNDPFHQDESPSIP
jgi:hypothetical protein